MVGLQERDGFHSRSPPRSTAGYLRTGLSSRNCTGRYVGFRSGLFKSSLRLCRVPMFCFPSSSCVCDQLFGVRPECERG